jgi:predicted ABC-type ATPase
MRTQLRKVFSAFALDDASFDAGRVMLERLHELAESGKDFAFETTLASRFYAGWLHRLKADGFRVSMIFLWLRDVEFALERVNERVRLGGSPNSRGNNFPTI